MMLRMPLPLDHIKIARAQVEQPIPWTQMLTAKMTCCCTRHVAFHAQDTALPFSAEPPVFETLDTILTTAGVRFSAAAAVAAMCKRSHVGILFWQPQRLLFA